VTAALKLAKAVQQRQRILPAAQPNAQPIACGTQPKIFSEYKERLRRKTAQRHFLCGITTTGKIQRKDLCSKVNNCDLNRAVRIIENVADSNVANHGIILARTNERTYLRLLAQIDRTANNFLRKPKLTPNVRSA
jgi:hypothetical protein